MVCVPHHYSYATWKTPEKRRQLVQIRRAQKYAARQGDLDLLREYVEILRGDPCSYCGQPAGEVDHIEPLARGGAEGWENFTAACRSCNARKHARPLLQFLMAGR